LPAVLAALPAKELHLTASNPNPQKPS
jgi:hypothetical protein